MFNIIQLQDRLKGMPDSALQTAASMPGEHQFLAVAELAERQRIRGAYANQAQQAQPTVAQRIMGGNPVAPVESPRADIGGLAAASNRGEMQPALGMYSGGAVPSAYYMADGGTPPAAPTGYGSGLPKELDTRTVRAQRLQPQEVEQMQLPQDNLFNMITGLGAYKDSGGYAGPMRAQFADSQQAYEQSVKDNLQENPYVAMIAAQEQDRARNAEMAKRDKWLALAQAGIGMASGSSPNFLTNVAAGGQAGLAALRQGMTEAEKRQAALQQRGDLLQAAGSTIQGNNAAAMRGVAQQGFLGETSMGRDIFTQGMGGQREEFTREHQSNENALQRGFEGTQKAADRAAQTAMNNARIAGDREMATLRDNAALARDRAERERLVLNYNAGAQERALAAMEAGLLTKADVDRRVVQDKIQAYQAANLPVPRSLILQAQSLAPAPSGQTPQNGVPRGPTQQQ